MRHNQDSRYWTPERRRQERRDMLLAYALLALIGFGASLWVNACDVHQVRQSPPVCQMTTTTQGFCND